MSNKTGGRRPRTLLFIQLSLSLHLEITEVFATTVSAILYAALTGVYGLIGTALVVHQQILYEEAGICAVNGSSYRDEQQILAATTIMEGQYWMLCAFVTLLKHSHHSLQRLFYAKDETFFDTWYNVKNALGILKVATKLECENIVPKCMQYLEAVPWEDSDEEEILKAFPTLGSSLMPVLARIQPVDSDAIRDVFISAIRAATLPESKCCEFLDNFPSDLKTAAQEQVEYMLVEDDDAPLLVGDDIVKAELRKCFSELVEGFKMELKALLQEVDDNLLEKVVLERVSDLTWGSRVLPKVGLLDDLVACWVETSHDVEKLLSDNRLQDTFWETKFKVVELTSKVLEAVGYGNAIIPADQRIHLVKVWLPYIRCIKPIFEANFTSGKMSQRMDAELSQTIELALVSLILSLPSSDQADILADWLKTDKTRFPDLSEAFEVWCMRSKSAKRRFSVDVSATGTTPIAGKSCGL